MQMSGKLVIIGIFGTAIVAAVAAAIVHYNSRRGVRDFWGSETALLIGRAPSVELLRLIKVLEAPEDGETYEIDGAEYEISSKRDVSKARGFVHVRDALIRDRGFEWGKERGDCVPQWEIAFRFKQGDAKAVVLIDFNCERVRLLRGGQEASSGPTIRAIKEWLDKEFPELISPD